jgi:hypothetical protein
MTATVDIVRRTHPGVWKVPSTAMNFQLDEHYQTNEAKARLSDWQQRPDRQDWRAVWVMKENKPWPVFVRTGGKNAQGESGIVDAQYYEVLEWEPGTKPDPQVPGSYPQLIVAAPEVGKSKLFNLPNIKF